MDLHNTTSTLSIGKKVYDLFGASGLIRSIETEKENNMITVCFNEHGTAKWTKYSISEIGIKLFCSPEDAKAACQQRLIKKMQQCNELSKLTGDYRDDVKQTIKSRRITELVHFTCLYNLPNILEYGLLPVETQISLNIASHKTDFFNCLTEFVSLSISFPNYQMFYNKQLHLDYDWIVLLIDPSLLIDHEPLLLFCPDNATLFLKQIRTDPNQFMGTTALLRLFHDTVETHIGKKTREELKLPLKHTSNPQAEVLIRGAVENKYLKGIVVSNAKVLKKMAFIYSDLHHKIRVFEDCEYFSYRPDYIFWK